MCDLCRVNLVALNLWMQTIHFIEICAFGDDNGTLETSFLCASTINATIYFMRNSNIISSSSSFALSDSDSYYEHTFTMKVAGQFIFVVVVWIIDMNSHGSLSN